MSRPPEIHQKAGTTKGGSPASEALVFRPVLCLRTSGGSIKKQNDPGRIRKPQTVPDAFRVVTISKSLLADTEPLDQRLVPSLVGALQKLQEPGALADHHKQAAT